MIAVWLGGGTRSVAPMLAFSPQHVKQPKDARCVRDRRGAASGIGLQGVRLDGACRLLSNGTCWHEDGSRRCEVLFLFAVGVFRSSSGAASRYSCRSFVFCLVCELQFQQLFVFICV